MEIEGIPSEVLKTYTYLNIDKFGDEIVLALRQKKGYISPMIIVKKKDLLEALK